MNKILLAIIIILALCSMAPGTPQTPPPPPPVETQPVETEPVVVTEEPAQPTEPIMATDIGDWPGYVPTTEGREPKEYKLPSGGYGPQSAPACASILLALVALAWKVLR